MPKDHIRYDILAQDALRGVIRTVLTDTAKHGLPGDHHFSITFDTKAEGVRMSARLREQYPDDITIVLQHQFWDLIVSEDSFEVGLSFGGVPERVTVPFDAIKAFVDPAVQFGLQFETVAQDETASPVAQDTKQDSVPPRVAEAAEAPDAEEAPADANPQGAEVVRLDRFRKK